MMHRMQRLFVKLNNVINNAAAHQVGEVQYRQMVIHCAAMCRKHSFLVSFPLLLQLCALLPSSRHLKARQLEQSVLGVHVLQDCSVLKDDSAPFTEEGQVVDCSLVHFLFVVFVL